MAGSLQRAQVQSLVRELRSHKPWGVVKKKRLLPLYRLKIVLGVLIHCHVALHSSPNDAEKQMHTANAAMAARPDSSGGTQPRPCGR